ncbi:MAG: hypothetical protein GY696_03745 [Gammaproteobacteria bacterium]|nr:hypothetical protein [Gammaproteobacteria bacterium]
MGIFGVIVLLFKSSNLILAAEKLNPGQLWTGLAVIGGLVLGVIKTRYLFQRLCLKNLMRIEALKQPKLWHFYRWRFFGFLFSMIALDGYLSRLAEGDYVMLIVIAFVELSVAIVLLGSSGCFFRRQ